MVLEEFTAGPILKESTPVRATNVNLEGDVIYESPVATNSMPRPKLSSRTVSSPSQSTQRIRKILGELTDLTHDFPMKEPQALRTRVNLDDAHIHAKDSPAITHKKGTVTFAPEPDAPKAISPTGIISCSKPSRPVLQDKTGKSHLHISPTAIRPVRTQVSSGKGHSHKKIKQTEEPNGVSDVMSEIASVLQDIQQVRLRANI
jgi:hypothetical protein